MFRIFVLINAILLISILNEANGLRCYSCSSHSGDRYCHEDSFDEARVNVIECPESADVCVRAIQTNNGSAGAIFRACGSSDQSAKKELLMLGYYPPYNKCDPDRKIGPESKLYNDSLFEICASSLDLGNGKGEMKFKKSN